VGATPRPSRKHLPHGVLLIQDRPTIVFLTVATKAREPWLATPENHRLLRDVWTDATAWFVGRYVLMPDHLHLFASPGEPELPLENWVRYWKSCFSRQHGHSEHRWQSDHWDTRLRAEESYDDKWEYVVQNPVRRGLVSKADQWPFQGEIFELRWW
jgi:putative transposase